MTISQVAHKPVEIFISYSRKDRHYLEELHKHLKVYERDQHVRIWHDGNLTPGVDWEPEIYEHFAAAQIILLLISSDFFDSEYCWQRELPEALQLHERGLARIVPVIIRPVDWLHSNLARFMVLPQDGRPVELWENRDAAYADIVRKLREVLVEHYGIVSLGQKPHGPWPARPPERPPQPGGRVRPPEEVATTPPPDEPLPLPEPITETPSHDDLDALVVPRKPPAISGQGTAPKVSAAYRFPVPDVFICFLHKERRDRLQRLRRWCESPGDPLFVGRAAHVNECQTLESALAESRQRAGGTILILDGFEPHCPQLEELLSSQDRRQTFDLIINAPEWESFAVQYPTASILRPTQTVTCDETVLETLRKSILRVRTRELAEVRVLRSKAELADFFALRYRVWTDLNYLPPEKICPKTPWEVDFTDRTSLPMGLFSKADGKLLAAARLVRGFGDEKDYSMIHDIEEMLRERNSKVLQARFSNPTSQQHPFDILGEMTRFKDYYCGLVRSGVSKAEVSRVIVAPGWQRAGLGEVVVDTLCSLARAHAISTLFLACHAKHADFYRRCKFEEIPGVTGTRFLSYDGPCVAMQRQLFGSADLADPEFD